MTEESPKSVHNKDDHDLHSWLKVSWAKNTHEVAVSETNNNGLSEKRAHIAEMEELSLQMDNEILSLSIIPYVFIKISHSLITGDWVEFDHFTENEENDSANNPIEEIHDLEEKPSTNVVHLIIPCTEVHLYDIDDVTEHEN